MEEAKWYLVHTNFRYENKVKENLENVIKNRNLGDQILEIFIPEEKVTEIKKGEKKEVTKKLVSQYVFVRMIMNSDTWYIVRNTIGVTGFVGIGNEPTPLSDEEVENIKNGIGKTEKIVCEFEVGDKVLVTSDPWAGFEGVVNRIDEGKQTVTINIDMLGRETPVEIPFSGVKKAD